MSILIRNGRIWDGERFFFADVLTEKEKIAAIAPNITEKASFVYNAAGQIVSAGLVDLHAHLQVHPSDKFGIQAEMSCFPFGVTAAADAGRLQGQKEIMDSFMLKNVVFVKAPIRENTVQLQKTEAALAVYGDRVAGIKVYFESGKGQAWDAEPLREVCDFAHARDLPVMVHCTDSPVPMSEFLEVLQAGDILTHPFHGGEHTAADDGYESLRRAQERGVVIDAGFAGHIHTDFAVFRGAVANGILPDTVSTDITRFSAYMRGGRYGMTMCMDLAKTAGMAEEDIFRTVTSAPAKVLKKEKEWGYLQVGRTADLAVLRETEEGFFLKDKAGNVAENKTGYRCSLTVSDGLVVFRD